MTPEYNALLVAGLGAMTYVLYACTICGAVVRDQSAHTTFHENLQANLVLGKRAREAFAKTLVSDEQPPF